ncbi:hypothetical protein AXF42_Ash000092 [Apostasia shenzhenica]|uniref:Embryo sac development arrest 6 n=1 Tax=Apostasia shenzhenica TaxID=1088818 RepID=A0A2I0AFC2_9ASPA|nr:hypothetical protein AXF42_Ash000092 [Apostasia shenzhenica]
MSSHIHPISRKRKERESTAVVEAASPPVAMAQPSTLPVAMAQPSMPLAPPMDNRLLAGYLAHEFLTKGTLLGERWPQERSELTIVPTSSRSGRIGLCEASSTLPVHVAKAYDDVAYLLKADGVHIPGVVNPTQLARWLQNPDGK